MWLIFSISAAGVMSNTLIVAAIPDILDHFGRGPSDAGILVAVGPAPAILITPMIGILADRFGRRALIAPSLVLFGTAGAVAGLSTSWPMLLTARFVQGIGGSGLIALSVVLISDHWEGEDRIRLIGRNTAVITVCLALFPALGGSLTQLSTWRMAFAPFALAPFVGVVMWWRLPGHRVGEVRTMGEQLRGMVAGLRRPVVALSTVYAAVVFILIFGLFLTTLPLFLDQEFGLGPRNRGLVTSVPSVTSTVAALLLYRVRSALGARGLLAGGSLLMGLAYVTMGLAPALWVMVAAALVYGWAEGLTLPTAQELVATNAPDRERAAVLGAYTATARTGQVIGPLVVGVALGFTGSRTVLVAGGVVLLLMTAVQLAVPFTRPRSSGVGSGAGGG